MRAEAACLGILLLAGVASASELPTPVASAFARTDGSAGGWAYTRTDVENGVTTVERFDPAAGNGGWTLVAIDGKAPSNKRLRKYAAKSERRATRDHPGDVDFRDIVDVNTVELVTETATSATYRFKPAPDDSSSETDDDDFSAYLEGTMVVDKTGPSVRTIELANTDPFSPATGVKIIRMRLKMEFAAGDEGGVAVRRLSQSVQGKLLGIKRIDQVQTVTYGPLRSGKPEPGQ